MAYRRRLCKGHWCAGVDLAIAGSGYRQVRRSAVDIPSDESRISIRQVCVPQDVQSPLLLLLSCPRNHCCGTCPAQQGRAITYHHTHIPTKKHDPYRTPPKNYVQLLQHITRAKKVDTLNKLVMHYGPKFDAVHVAAAMSMLPKLYQPVVPGTRISPRRVKQQRETPGKLLQQLQVTYDISSILPAVFSMQYGMLVRHDTNSCSPEAQ